MMATADPSRSQVKLALENKFIGNSVPYNALLSQLKQGAFEDYSSLSQCVSVLSRHSKLYQALIHELYCFDWKNHSNQVVDAYGSFLCHLVSSNGTFVLPSLRMLIKQLVPVVALSNAATDPDPDPDATTDATDDASSQTSRAKVLQTLQHVLNLVPTACNALFPVLVENFPHKSRPVAVQVGYLENLLCVVDYIPNVQGRVVALIMEKMVEIDVEIGYETTIDDNDDDNDEMADKLDQMMMRMFKFVEKKNGGVGEQAVILFQQLLRVFDRAILHTHRCKFPQFLLFYLCYFHADFQHIFVNQLVYIALSHGAPMLSRQNCLLYLASYLARAKYVSIELIHATIIQLMNSLHESTEQSSHPLTDHSMSTVVFQSVCYILCFRAEEIVEVSGTESLRNLGWQTILCQNPNLLDTCMDEIMIEFQILATRLRFVSIPERDGNHQMNKKKDKHTTTTTPLVLFFPFDPYVLPKSATFIHPLYLSWKGHSMAFHETPHPQDPAPAVAFTEATDSEHDDDLHEEEEEDGF